VGTSTGAVQVFDLATAQLLVQLSVHQSPVKGVEWGGRTQAWVFVCFFLMLQLLTYAVEEIGAQQRGMVAKIDCRTWAITFLRDKTCDGLVSSVRVSPRGQYVMVLVKGKPLELYDLATVFAVGTDDLFVGNPTESDGANLSYWCSYPMGYQHQEAQGEGVFPQCIKIH
jgi:hypothetical protein